MEVSNQVVEELRLEDGTLSDMTYSECTLRKWSLAKVVMRNVAFVNCTFDACSFRNVAFRGCSMLNGVFRDCTLLGLDWSEMRRHGARLSMIAAMRRCGIRYNTFINVKMARIDFEESILHDCFFQECALKLAVFKGTDFRDTIFQNCDLSGADFRDAHGYAIDIRNNVVTKARFSQPDVIGLLCGMDIFIE